MPNPGKPANNNGKSPPPPPGRVNKITASNYAIIAKRFMIAHADDPDMIGFMIATKNLEIGGVEIEQSLLQWAAWKAYFRKKRIKHSWMQHTDHYMVPAEWPYLFDSDESAQDAGPRYQQP